MPEMFVLVRSVVVSKINLYNWISLHVLFRMAINRPSHSQTDNSGKLLMFSYLHQVF